MKRENKIQTEILEYLKGNPKKGIKGVGGWWLNFHGGSVYMPRGIPDIIGCYKGMFIAIEVKRPGEEPRKIQEEPRKIQEHTIKLLKEAGAKTFVAYGVDDVKNIIEGFNYD